MRGKEVRVCRVTLSGTVSAIPSERKPQELFSSQMSQSRAGPLAMCREPWGTGTGLGHGPGSQGLLSSCRATYSPRGPFVSTGALKGLLPGGLLPPVEGLRASAWQSRGFPTAGHAVPELASPARRLVPSGWTGPGRAIQHAREQLCGPYAPVFAPGPCWASVPTAVNQPWACSSYEELPVPHPDCLEPRRAPGDDHGIQEAAVPSCGEPRSLHGASGG